MMTSNDTIAAISTPLGQGGIGIIRLSGSSAIGIAGSIFFSPRSKSLSYAQSHTLHHGFVKDPGTEDIMDEVLVSVMRAPFTYTSEDTVEINCHGGIVPLRKVLELCLKKGARLAEPGEFTKRAFLSGRIDLSQAEAALDMIKAESDASHRAAAGQLGGAFSRVIRSLREDLVGILSDIELAVDFTEEDVSFASVDNIMNGVSGIKATLGKLLDTAEKGIILRHGVKAVICGRPNVGKSSLMNALLKRERVIVTPLAGTTRDVVEESLNIGGVSLRLSDTAGIIGTADLVEQEGIKRAKEKIAESDIAIFMIDAAKPLNSDDREIHGMLSGKKTIVVMNKIDLANSFSEEEAKKFFNIPQVFKVSVLKGGGLDALESAISGIVLGGKDILREEVFVTNLRHKEALEKALAGVENAMKLSGKDYNAELVASDLNEALRALGLITGETVDDAVLDRIFSQFCIGK